MSETCCWRDGNPDSDICIIGMAPGRQELTEDRPLVGPSGKLFWRLCTTEGIDRSHCYILNIIGEWPEGKTGGPSKDQLQTWHERFDAALSKFTGRWIVCLGGDAFHRVTGIPGTLEEWRGYLVYRDDLGRIEVTRKIATTYKSSNKARNVKKGDIRWLSVKESAAPLWPSRAQALVPTLHPAGVLRSGFTTAPLLNADIQKLGRLIRGETRSPREAFVERPLSFPGSRAISVDLEGFTSIDRIGMADHNDAYSVVWGHNAARSAQEVLSRKDVDIIIHNGAFDVPMLQDAGIRIEGRVWDTMIAQAFLNPDMRKGLNFCGSIFLDCPRWKHLMEDRPAYYNALDAIREFELYEVMKAQLRETGQTELFENVILPGLPVLWDMKRRGMYLDPERQRAWIKELGEQAVVANKTWYSLAGDVNAHSSHAVKAMLRNKGVELPKNSADKEALMNVKAHYPEYAPLIDALIRVRQIHKQLATYASIKAGTDGCVHPDFTPTGKDQDGLGKDLPGTFRLSAKNPNMQNQTAAARGMYRPRPGHCYVGADFSSLEAFLFHGCSGDEELGRDLRLDLHNITSLRLNIDRVRAKNGFYGWMYGSGARTLYNTFFLNGYKVTLAQCQALLDGFNVYSTATRWRNDLIALSRAKGYVENPFGFRRYFSEQEFPVTKVTNTYIQSTGAFMMWHVMKPMDDELKQLGVGLVNQVHDSVLAEVRIEHRDQALEIIERHMTRRFDQIAPGFSCGVKTSWSDVSWGDMK